MSGAGHAVEAHRIHRRIGLRLMDEMGSQLSRAGKSVRLGCKGGDDIRLRLLFPDVPGDFTDAGKAAQGLKQEVRCPQLQEYVHGEPEFLQRPLGVGHGHRAQVCKYKCIPGGLLGNVPARFDDLPAGFLPHGQPIRPKGVGFDGIAAGSQIGLMHRLDLLRGLQIGGLAAVGRAVVLGHEIAAHGPVENQRMLLQKCSNIHCSVPFVIPAPSVQCPHSLSRPWHSSPRRSPWHIPASKPRRRPRFYSRGRFPGWPEWSPPC